MLNRARLAIGEIRLDAFGSKKVENEEKGTYETLVNTCLTLFVETFESDCELTASETTAPNCFLERVSEAFSSITS